MKQNRSRDSCNKTASILPIMACDIYVGWTPQKMAATLKVYKWHARNACVRLVNDLHEPCQTISSASMGNRTVNFALLQWYVFPTFPWWYLFPKQLSLGPWVSLCENVGDMQWYMFHVFPSWKCMAVRYRQLLKGRNGGVTAECHLMSKRWEDDNVLQMPWVVPWHLSGKTSLRTILDPKE